VTTVTTTPVRPQSRRPPRALAGHDGGHARRSRRPSRLPGPGLVTGSRHRLARWSRRRPNASRTVRRSPIECH